MRRLETIKRVIVLGLSMVGLLIQTMIYAYIWFSYYYPVVNNFNRGLKFYRYGHLLILAIYFILLFFFTNTYGGLKIGYLKTTDVFLSQMFSLLFVNIITYGQISLMNNNLVMPDRMMEAALVQILFAGMWTAICNTVYRRVFPPREMLLVHGERNIDDILRKFASRKDKYKIVK